MIFNFKVQSFKIRFIQFLISNTYDKVSNQEDKLVEKIVTWES